MSNKAKTAQRTGKTSLILAAALVIFLFTNCENFMNGNNNFLQNLESQISVANAPVITVRLQPIQNSGTTVPAPGDISFKLNVVKQLEFTVNADTYVFDHWAVYDRTAYEAGARIELSGIVTFSNSRNPKTNATVIKSTPNLLIVPVCSAHPVITLKAEPGTGTISPTVPITAKVNTAVEIEFIPNEGLYVFDHWAAYDKTEYELGNRIELEEFVSFTNSKNTKTKAVVLDYHYNLLIVPVCFEHPKITIETQENSGTITPSGEKIIEINEPFSITIHCNEQYSFVRWAAYIISGETEEETSTALIFSDAMTANDLMSSTVIATLKERRSDIVIRPVLQKRPSVSFEAEPNSGLISPSGIKLINLNTPMEISMTCSPSYGFISWAAYIKNANTYTETDAVTFQQENTLLNLSASSVHALLSENLENIVIRPVCAQRPSVRSTIPTQGEKNVYRNTAVYIDFTKPIPLNTFDNFNNLTIMGSTNVTAEEPQYDSYEKYFEEPVLSESRKRLILRSATASGGEQLPRYASVSVTISADVTDDFDIPTGNEYSLSFTAGKEGDTEPPIFEDIIVSRAKDLPAFNPESNLSAAVPNLPLSDFIQNRTKNTVNLGIKASAPSPDNTDYITSFTLTETLVYTTESGQGVPSNKKQVNFSLDPDDDGYVWYTYDIVNSATTPNGVVQLQIQATDSNANITPIEEYTSGKSNSFFVFFDQTPPNVTGTNLANIPAISGATPAGWYNESVNKIITIPAAGAGMLTDNIVDAALRLHSLDLTWEFSLNGTDWTTASPTASPASLDVTQLFSGDVELEDQNIRVRYMDDVGNTSETGIIDQKYKVDTKAPPPPVITMSDPNPWAFADIPNAKYWIKQSGKIQYTLTLASTDLSGIAGYRVDTSTVDQTGNTFTVGSGGDIEGYTAHTIYAVDGAGNVSTTGTTFYTFEDVTPPKTPTMSFNAGQTGVYAIDAANYWTKNSSVLFTLVLEDEGSDPSGPHGYTLNDGIDITAGTDLSMDAEDADTPASRTIKAVDNVGNISINGIDVKVGKDTTAPVLETLTASGTNGGTGYVNIKDNYKVNVTIPFTEARSGVQDIQFNNTICSSLTGITVKNNGAELVLDDEYEISGKSIRFTPPLKISPLEIEGITINTGDAEKDLMLALVDAVNNQGDKGELKFKLDTTRPVVTAVNPEIFPGTSSYFNNTQTKYYLNTNAASVIYFKPEASDLNGISVYNSTGLLTGVGWNVPIPLGAGENQGLYAVDTAKNVSLPWTVTIVEDITPPSKPVISASGFKFFIKEGYLYDKSLVQKNYTLTSTDSGSDIYYYYINDTSQIAGTLGQPAVLPVDKGVTFKVTAKDRVGNVSDGLTLTSVGDITPPTILDETGTDTLLKGNKNDGTPPEQADFSSDNTVDAVIYFDNENTPAESAGVRFIRFSYSEAGAYLNVAEVTEVLDGDNNPIGFEIWKDNGNTYDIELKLSTSIHDSPITVKNLTIANTSGDGFYEPTIHYIADAVENVAAQSLPVAITIDSTPPEITGVSITSTGNIKEADGIYYYNNIPNVPITLTMSDTNLYGYSLNGAAAVSGTSLNYTAAADDTTYDLVFKAVDKAGNLSTGSQSIKVRKDTAKPASSISLYGTNGGNDYINIEDDYKVNALVTFTRDNVGVKTLTFTGLSTAVGSSVEYSTDGGTIYSDVSGTSITGQVITLPASSNFTTGIFRVTGLTVDAAEGSRTIGVTLTDAIGNMQETAAEDQINQDRTRPVLNGIYLYKPDQYYWMPYGGTDPLPTGKTLSTSLPRVCVGITNGTCSEPIQGYYYKNTSAGTFSTTIVPVASSKTNYTNFQDFWLVPSGPFSKSYPKASNTGGTLHVNVTNPGMPNVTGNPQYLKVVDLAGNESNGEFWFQVGSDTANPEITSFGVINPSTGVSPTTAPVGNGDTFYTRNGSITFPIYMNDGTGSGISGYIINDDPKEEAVTGDSLTISGTEGGTGTLNSIYAVDNVGNISTPAKTVRVIKDSIAPNKNSGVLSFYETTDTTFTTSIIATKNTSVSIKMTDLTEVSSGIKVITITGLANTEFTPVIKIGATQVFNTPVTPSGGSVTITLDTPYQKPTNGTVTITNLPITEVDGSKPITVQFTDAVENTHETNSTYSASVYYDESYPIVTGTTQIDEVTGGFTKNLGGHSFAFTTYDAGSGVKTITLSGANFTNALCAQASTVTGKTITGCTLNFTTPITSATPITVTGITLTTSNAVNTITASIVDALGNTPTATSASITHDSLLSVTLNSVTSSVTTDKAGYTGSTLVDLTFTPATEVNFSGIVSIDFTNCTDVANITSAAVTGGVRDSRKFTFAIPITEASPLTIEDISITGGTDGLKTIRPVFTDKAGNTFTPTSEGSITYDSTAPLNNSGEMTFHLVDDTDFATPITATKSTSAHIKITKLTESSSGIKTIRISGLRDIGSFGPIVKINGSSVYNGLPDVTGGITTFNLSSSYQITDGTVTISGLPITLSQDDKEIAVEFIDAVGKTNESSKYTASISLDYTAPSATAFTLAGANGGTGYINGSDSLTAKAVITTAADTSGVKKITFSADGTGFDSLATTEVSINGAAPLSLITSGVPTGDQFLLSGSTITLGTPITAASTITINGITVTSTDGEKDVDITLTDAAGNVSAVIDGGVHVDTTAPVLTLSGINSASTANTCFDSGTYYSSASSAFFDLTLSDTLKNSYKSDIYGHVVDSGTPETGSTVELTSNAAETTYTIKAVDKAGNVSTDSVTITTILHTTAPSDVTLTLSGNGTTSTEGYVNLADQQKAKALIEFTKLTVGVNKLVFSGDISSISGAEVAGLNSADYTVDDTTKTITLVTPVTSTGGATPVPAALTVTGLTVTADERAQTITVTLHDVLDNTDSNSDDDDSITHDKTHPTLTNNTNLYVYDVNQIHFNGTTEDCMITNVNGTTTSTAFGTSPQIPSGITITRDGATSNTATIMDRAGNKTTYTFTEDGSQAATIIGVPLNFSRSAYPKSLFSRAAMLPPTSFATQNTETKTDLFIQRYTYLPAAEYVFADTTQITDTAASKVSKPDADVAAAVPVSFKQPMQTEQNTLPVNEGISLTTSSGSILFAPEKEAPAKDTASSPSVTALTNSFYIEATDTKTAVETSFSTPAQSIGASEVQEPAPIALVIGLILLLGMGVCAAAFAVIMIKKCKKVQ